MKTKEKLTAAARKKKTDKDTADSSLKARYGQTNKNVSLYDMFQTFKVDALMTRK